MNRWEKRTYFERIALQTGMEILEEADAYLLLYCQNVFSDDFFLQLQWNYAAVEWTRNTLPTKENFALWDTFNENENALTFTLWQEKGVLERKKLDKLFAMLENLKIKPLTKLKSGEGRDGEIMELTIGTANVFSTFHWHNCETEAEWKSLDEVADFLWEFNKSLKCEEKEVLHFSILTATKKMK